MRGGDTEIERDHRAQSGGRGHAGDAGLGQRIAEQALQRRAAGPQRGTDDKRQQRARQADFARHHSGDAVFMKETGNQIAGGNSGGADKKRKGRAAQSQHQKSPGHRHGGNLRFQHHGVPRIIAARGVHPLALAPTPAQSRTMHGGRFPG